MIDFLSFSILSSIAELHCNKIQSKKHNSQLIKCEPVYTVKYGTTKTIIMHPSDYNRYLYTVYQWI